MRHRKNLLLIVLFLFGAFATTVSAAPQAQSGERCFSETNYCISGRIREFWEQNGGLPVFGYPIGEQRAEVIEGKTYQAQWFQRNRLELHPENAPPYDVLIGRIGADRLSQQGRDWMKFAPSTPRANCRFFPETGHNVCGAILAAWHANGLESDGRRGKSEGENLGLYGLPLSDEQPEVLQGVTYTVQWFERARFELHPENAPPYNVLLGLLGNETRQYAPPAQPPAQPTAQPPAQPTAQPPAPTTRPKDDDLTFTDAPPNGNVDDNVDGIVRIAGAKTIIKNDDGTVEKVIVGDSFSVRVKVRLTDAEKNEDGAGIHNVVFQVDGNLYERTENAPAYCMFGGGDDRTEQSCNAWTFSEHNNSWPDGSTELDTNTTYNVRIFVRALDDTKVADWNFELEVQP